MLPCRVLALAPTDVASLSNRGYAFRKLSAFQKAAADYSLALQLSPGTVRLPGSAAALDHPLPVYNRPGLPSLHPCQLGCRSSAARATWACTLVAREHCCAGSTACSPEKKLESSGAGCPCMPAVATFVLSKPIFGGLHVELVTNALCHVLHLPAPLHRAGAQSGGTSIPHPVCCQGAAPPVCMDLEFPSQTDLTEGLHASAGAPLKAMHLLLMSASCQSGSPCAASD